MDKCVEIAVIAVCLMIASVLWTGECFASDDLKYRLNFVPFSRHHGETNTTNEKHHGIGISLTLSSRTTYGAMHFINSYGVPGWLVTASKEYVRGCLFCPGLGIGYSPTYKKVDKSPVIGWLSLRYKWVTLLTAPKEVTALMLSVPFK